MIRKYDRSVGPKFNYFDDDHYTGRKKAIMAAPDIEEVYKVRVSLILHETVTLNVDVYCDAIIPLFAMIVIKPIIFLSRSSFSWLIFLTHTTSS